MLMKSRYIREVERVVIIYFPVAPDWLCAIQRELLPHFDEEVTRAVITREYVAPHHHVQDRNGHGKLTRFLCWVPLFCHFLSFEVQLLARCMLCLLLMPLHVGAPSKEADDCWSEKSTRPFIRNVTAMLSRRCVSTVHRLHFHG